MRRIARRAACIVMVRGTTARAAPVARLVKIPARWIWRRSGSSVMAAARPSRAPRSRGWRRRFRRGGIPEAVERLIDLYASARAGRGRDDLLRPASMVDAVRALELADLDTGARPGDAVPADFVDPAKPTSSRRRCWTGSAPHREQAYRIAKSTHVYSNRLASRSQPLCYSPAPTTEYVFVIQSG